MDARASSFPEDYGSKWSSRTRGQYKIPSISAAIAGHSSYRTDQNLRLFEKGTSQTQFFCLN